MGKPICKVGEDGLIYCAPHIPEEDYTIIPGISGYECIDMEIEYGSSKEMAEAMCQNAITYAVIIRVFGEGSPPLPLLPKDHTRYLL